MFNDRQIERMALFHIYAGDEFLLKQLEPEDFDDDGIRSVFIASGIAYTENGKVEISPVDHLLSKNKAYPGLLWLIDLIAPMYTADPRATVRLLHELRARRAARGFDASQDAAESLPGTFMAKGRDIQSLLQSDVSPMSTLAEEIKRKTPMMGTGFLKMDDLLGGGIEDGSLFVVASRPSVGKTTLSLNIAAHILSKGQQVCFISLETPRRKVATRLLQHFWGESKERVEQHIDDMIDLPGELFIEDAQSELPRVLSAMASKLEAQVFIVDHMHLISDRTAKNDLAKLEKISRSMKLFAMENKKPVILLCQLNRQIENASGNREPELSDLRGSGSIEQDADVVTFLWNPNAKEEMSSVAQTVKSLEGRKARVVNNSKIHWIVRKNRDGRCGTVELNFKPETFSFKE